RMVGQRAQDIQSCLLGHSHIEQEHIRPQTREQRERLLSIVGLGHHSNIVSERQEAADSLTHQGLIVGEENLDHDEDSTSGRKAESAKPRGTFSIDRAPPSSSRRSLIPESPFPSVRLGAPRPSSRAERVTPSFFCTSTSQRFSAPE